MDNFVFAIPSYKRADKQETLDYLNSIGFKKENIYIFVQNQEDKIAYDKYKQKANIVFAPAKFIARARNNILNYLVNSYNVVMLDDDIKHIAKLVNGKLVPINNAIELKEEILNCYALTEKNGAKLFGIYPVPNEFFMKCGISTKVTINTMLCFCKGFEERFDETYLAKEDLELCGRLLNRNEKVMRFNELTAKAKHRTNKGGCNDMWKTTENEKAVIRLCETYPHIFAKHRTKNNEVRVILKDEKI